MKIDLPRFSINILDGSGYIEKIRELIIEYAESLNRDLSFQDFDEEIKNIEGKYLSPNGELLAAVTSDNNVVGCVALHRHDDIRCEMKRLYVKPAYRKEKIGRRLIEKIITRAREDGYKEMVLDTIEPLQNAIRLYKKYGFIEIPAYYDNPMPDVIYMKLDLD